MNKYGLPHRSCQKARGASMFETPCTDQHRGRIDQPSPGNHLFAFESLIESFTEKRISAIHESSNIQEHLTVV